MWGRGRWGPVGWVTGQMSKWVDVITGQLVYDRSLGCEDPGRETRNWACPSDCNLEDVFWWNTSTESPAVLRNKNKQPFWSRCREVQREEPLVSNTGVHCTQWSVGQEPLLEKGRCRPSKCLYTFAEILRSRFLCVPDSFCVHFRYSFFPAPWFFSKWCLNPSAYLSCTNKERKLVLDLGPYGWLRTVSLF